MPGSLKEQNQGALSTALLLNSFVFVALLTTDALIVPGLTGDVSSVLKPITSAGVTVLLVGVLNHQLDHTAKARLVFWRWKHPLPGSEAFSKYALGDPRIDMQAIVAKIGEIPTEPAAQNVAWYKLYRLVADDPSVANAHKRYLLCRDYACLSFLFLVFMMPVALWCVRPIGTAVLYGVMLLGQYLLVRNAAAERGRRFVCNVLAAHMGGTPSVAPVANLGPQPA